MYIIDPTRTETTASGAPGLDCSGSDLSFEVHGWDVGNRIVKQVVIANFDLDPELELGIARTGRNGSEAPRVLIYQVGEFPNNPESWVPTRHSLAAWQDDNRHANALAVGDLDGDGIPEVAVGRSSGSGGRYSIYRFDPVSQQYDGVFEGGNGWGSTRSTTALAFGDFDGDGDDELAIGRNEDSSDPSPKLFVVDVNASGTGLDTLAELESWSGKHPRRWVTSLATGDLDGDQRDEILVGRSVGDNARVILIDDALNNFSGLKSTGSGWGSDRQAMDVAVAPHFVCQAYRPKPTPANAAVAGATRLERFRTVISRKAWQMLDDFSCSQAETPLDQGLALLGPWSKENAGEAIRRMSAGLLAMQAQGLQLSPELLEAKQILTSIGFPAIVEAYVTQPDFRMLAGVGTHEDFDFNLTTIASLLYRFRNASHLLTDAAVDRLRHIDCESTDSGFDCPNRQVVHNLTTEESFHSISLTLPETENHVLMINAWHYLMGQWDEQPDRTEALVARPPSALEDKLLEILGRVLTNGMWETNSRAYESYSFRVFQLLSAHSVSEPLQKAAENAADYVAAKYTFQSLRGKRYAPMRRSWGKRNEMKLRTSDYLDTQLGVLTGDYQFDTAIDCEGPRCRMNQGLSLNWALESLLTEYHVPHLVMEHMLKPDGGKEGHGSWARMQARYQEEDYDIRQAGNYDSPALPGEVVEPAHEFYFRTANYLNSSGGRWEHYSSFADSLDETLDDVALATYGVAQGLEVMGMLTPVPAAAWSLILPIALEFTQDQIEKAAYDALHDLDFLAKPTALIGAIDGGYWTGASTAELQTIVFRGNYANTFESNNTGVYKNFALGYSTEYEELALHIPDTFDVAAEGESGGKKFWVLDPNSTTTILPNSDHFVVIGAVMNSQNSARKSMGFYEVIPREGQTTAAQMLQTVLSNNGGGAGAFSYVMSTSGESLTFNPAYPDGAPFLAIDGDTTGSDCMTDRLSCVHHRGTDQTANFPLIEVREVDENSRFTGKYYACGTGDGLVVINHPSLEQRLILDARDKSNPKNCIQASNEDACPDILGGTIASDFGCFTP